MMRPLLICAAAMTALSLASAAPVRADYGYGHGGYLNGWDASRLYNQLYNNLPYFALHPPVYYSYPVPRTYGYSPFAYPPHVMTPEIVGESKPLEIINPHVPSTQQDPSTQRDAAETKPDRTAADSAPTEPLVIVNPFVVNGQAVARSDR